MLARYSCDRHFLRTCRGGEKIKNHKTQENARTETLPQHTNECLLPHVDCPLVPLLPHTSRRSQNKQPLSRPSHSIAILSREKEGDKNGAAKAMPAVPAMPPRTGPMVAVYLDEASVEKLHREYPGTSRGRLRKVVIQYGPSDEQRSLYDGQFGGLATVKVRGTRVGGGVRNTGEHTVPAGVDRIRSHTKSANMCPQQQQQEAKE